MLSTVDQALLPVRDFRALLAMVSKHHLVLLGLKRQGHAGCHDSPPEQYLAIQEPHCHIAGLGMAPHQIAVAIAIKIAHPDDLPDVVDGGPYQGATEQRGTTEKPRRDLAGLGMAPH